MTKDERRGEHAKFRTRPRTWPKWLRGVNTGRYFRYSGSGVVEVEVYAADGTRKGTAGPGDYELHSMSDMLAPVAPTDLPWNQAEPLKRKEAPMNATEDGLLDTTCPRCGAVAVQKCTDEGYNYRQPGRVRYNRKTGMMDMRCPACKAKFSVEPLSSETPLSKSVSSNVEKWAFGKVFGLVKWAIKHPLTTGFYAILGYTTATNPQRVVSIARVVWGWVS